MGDNDWNTVTVIGKRAPRASELRTDAAVNRAKRDGVDIETTKKYAAGGNKQRSVDANTSKLDQETEELHHAKVSMDVGRLIQQGRQHKEWSQKDLAQKINEKPQVINDYENGRAIPNQQILAKIERQIGMKLRGKEKGQPLQPKSKKK